MTTSKNDITGDEIKSRINSNDYRDGWERIFGNRNDDNDDVVVDVPESIEHEETFK